jgi:uracil phosphoribosyltransferase
MDNVHEISHPLIQHSLTRLRDVTTQPEEFRAIVTRLTGLLAYEATRDLEVESVSVQTPLQTAAGSRLAERIGIIPILRAGLGMAESLLEIIPAAEVWHLGFYRDESTLKPVVYYNKLPLAEPVEVGILVDPMLATGGSGAAAVRAVHEWGVTRIKFLAILAAPEGIGVLKNLSPDIEIYVCAVDERLNDQGYIVPGLGDAGDRMFNTRWESADPGS